MLFFFLLNACSARVTQLEKVSLQLLAKALCHSLISSSLGTPEGDSAMVRDGLRTLPKRAAPP